MQLPNTIFEGRHQMKWWLAGKEDSMFTMPNFKQVCLWCDVREDMVVIHQAQVAK